MGISAKNKKRVLIFSVVPVLAAIPFFTEDLILRIIAASLAVIYVGFIIFLRDSAKQSPYSAQDEQDDYDSSDPSSPHYDTDSGEEFTIVSPNKDMDVITSDTYTPSVSGKRKNIFKPPDLKETFEQIANEALPADVSHDEHFAFVLEKMLTVIKESYFGYSALFFWYNKKKERLTLERYVSASENITEQKFGLEDDVLSKIVKNEEPEILSDISQSAEKDVIRYYTEVQGIKSFVGVPLFYGKILTGVLVVDSKEKDAFGIETIYSLGRFIRVISIIIGLFEEKFTESQAEQRLQALLGILSSDKKFEDEQQLFQTLEHTVKDLIFWDAFTFVYFEPETRVFKTSRIYNKKRSLKYVGENLEVSLEETLVGKAITSGLPVKIDDTSNNNYVRYSKSEDVSFDGTFLAIPLVYDDQNYGVLCFESLKRGAYSNADVTFVKNATKFFAFIVYSFSTQGILRNLLSVDIETRLLNGSEFQSRVTTELLKAREMGVPSALAVIRVDDFLDEDSLFEGSPLAKVLMSVSDTIRQEMNPFIIAGRLDTRKFGVFFFNAPSKDAFLWSEKLRIQIARKPLSVLSRQTTFTVSIGVASSSNKTEFPEVLDNAGLALEKALEKGGNTVKSIN